MTIVTVTKPRTTVTLPVITITEAVTMPIRIIVVTMINKKRTQYQ